MTDASIFLPKILIVDDEPLARKRLRQLLSDIEIFFPHTIIGESASASDFKNKYESLNPDIVFMDINLPDASGIDLVENYKSSCTEFIFLTAREDCALKAFNLDAADYLLKPVKSERLLSACTKAIRNIKDKKQVPELKIIERGQIISISVSDIYYCHSDTKYTTLKTLNGEYISNDSLVMIEEQYPDWFIRIHRSTLVNKHVFKRIYKETDDDSWVAEINDLNINLPISRRQLSTVKEKLKLK